MYLTAQIDNDTGFTLTELMIVTTLMGLLAILSAPFLSDLRPQLQLQSATNQLVWTLMAARVQAITTGQDVIVNFINAHEYEIGSDLNENSELDEDEGQVISIQDAASSVTIFASNNLTFNAKGSSNNSISVSLSNAIRTRTVLVTFAGLVKLDD